MSTRKLLLIFIPAAALLMFALLQQASDVDSMSGMQALQPAADAERDAALPSIAVVDAGRAPGAIEPIAAHLGGVEGTRADAEAAAALVQGRITGTLVDATGKPVPHEPVLLMLERDPWVRRDGRPNDNERPRQLMASAKSGADGRFTLEARAGVRHALLAGGATWARSVITPVQAGDDLRVVLSEGRQIEGTVVDGASGSAVAGAYVLGIVPDDALLARSDESGHFKLGPLPDLGATVGGWAPGFEVKLQSDISPASGPLTLELAAGREVKGRVVNRVTQQPVTSGGSLTLTVDVMARLTGGEPVATLPVVAQTLTATLGSDGSFRFPAGPSMGFDIRTRADGYVPDAWDRAETRPLGPGDEVIIALWPLGTVAGIVRHDGQPVGGAPVRASSPNGPFFETTSGPDGRFTLTLDKWDGERPVFVESIDASAGLGARARLGRQDEELALDLVPALTLSVQVVAKGAPVVGAEVAALSKRASPTFARTAANGMASVTHLLAGPDIESVSLQARFADRQSLPLELDLTAPLPSGPLVLDLDGGAFIEGVVADRSDTPVPSVDLSFRPNDERGADDRGGDGRGGNRGDGRGRDNRGPPAAADFGGGNEDDDGGPSARWTAARSDAAGHFRIGPLRADAVGTLVARARDYRDATLTDIAADSTDVAVQMEPIVHWEGRVVDVSTGMPLKDWLAVLQEEGLEKGKAAFHNTRELVEHKSGAPGDFSVSLPERGRFQLRVSSANSIAATSIPVDFNGVDAPQFTVIALSPAAVLEVTLLDSRGRPVDGYTIALIDWAKGGSAELPTGDARKGAKIGRTDSAGHARFQLGDGGSYRVAGGPGLWMDGERLDCKPGAPMQRTYTLPPTGDLEVTVVDEQGRPLPGVRVDVRSSKSEKVHSVSRRTSAQTADGRVVVEALPPGDYDVTSRRRGYDDRQDSVLIKGDAIERLSVILKQKAP